jgi:hypothetical protein
MPRSPIAQVEWVDARMEILERAVSAQAELIASLRLGIAGYRSA